MVSIENLQIDTNAIKSTNTNGNIQLFPNGTGFTELYGNTNAGAIRFNCESNSHGVTLKGPPHSASATYSLELPNADGSAVSFSRQTAVANWRLQAIQVTAIAARHYGTGRPRLQDALAVILLAGSQHG